jgi:PPP family 3-phenylpropionic acid transporter
VLLISTARSFGSLIPFVIAYAIFSSPIVPLLDSSALAVAERSNHSYGQLRLWGSVGWAASTLLVGAIIERFAIRWLFYSYVGLILVTFLIAFLQRPRAQAIRVSLRRGLKEMLTDRALALFLVTIFLISLTLGAANSFFSLYLDGLGAQEGAIGLAWAIAALSEIPVMLYSGRIMRRIGARGLLYVALVTFAGRWLLYSFIRVPALAIAVQVLHGLSFATYLVGGVTYMSEHAPAGLSTTAQSLFNLVAFGLGSIAGSLVGGYLYQTAGVTTLFRALSVIAAGGFVLFLISQRWPGNAARDRVPAMDSPEQ